MRRAFSLIEIMIAVVIAAVSFVTFMTVFSSSYRLASTTRNHQIAAVLAHSLLEEVQEHPFGAEQPKNWEDGEETPARIFIQGRPVDGVFHKHFSYLNGSFVGKAAPKAAGAPPVSDVVTITLTWKDESGSRQTGPARPKDPNSQDTKQLVVSVPVWP